MADPSLNRSNSRSRRSHASFSDLRLAPLTTSYNPPAFETEPIIPQTHKSYLPQRSAPSSPRLPSRSSSSKRFLNPQYTHDPTHLSAPTRPATKSRSSPHLQSRKRHRTSESWLTHTASFTSVLLSESKGGSAWHVPASPPTSDSDTEEEENVFRTARTSPVLVREGWGSRFGSRGVSRVGTPVNEKATGVQGYFDGPLPDFVNESDRRAYKEEEEEEDGDVGEEEIRRLARRQEGGIAGLVDRVVGFGFFDLSSLDQGSELEEREARRRKRVERQDTREKEERMDADADADAGQPDEGSAWGDAKWLLSTAARALV